jgi:hypothetical protein
MLSYMAKQPGSFQDYFENQFKKDLDQFLSTIPDWSKLHSQSLLPNDEITIQQDRLRSRAILCGADRHGHVQPSLNILFHLQGGNSVPEVDRKLPGWVWVSLESFANLRGPGGGARPGVIQKDFPRGRARDEATLQVSF